MIPSPVSTTLSSNRRSFLRRALAAGTGAALLPGVLARTAGAGTVQEDAAASSDLAVLNFALQLEYLEGQYYSLAVSGQTLEQAGIDTSGTGNHGAVTVKSNPMVNFQSDTIKGVAKEIASDEANHVKFLRAAISEAGATPVAQPPIDLLNSFNALSQLAGLGDTFDPFANELSFLLGAFIFEDVGVTAYRGGSTKITDRAYLKAAAGILAVEAIHAAEIRALLFAEGSDFIKATIAISAARDSLDGTSDHDQPIQDANGNANIAPTNINGLVYARNTRRVLNIVYGKAGANSGGFFPSGVN